MELIEDYVRGEKVEMVISFVCTGVTFSLQNFFQEGESSLWLKKKPPYLHASSSSFFRLPYASDTSLPRTQDTS